MLQIQTFTFNPFQENTYVLYDETGSCIIIDPGCYESWEREELIDFITNKKLNVEKIVNTHCHLDHVFGNNFFKKKYNVPLYIHEKEKEVLAKAHTYAAFYGVPMEPAEQADFFFDEKEKLTVGDEVLDIFFTPGHSPGSISFYHKAQGILISGDVLFKESIGRTDLPGGNFKILMQSIFTHLLALPESTKVYSGHGPVTTISYEIKHNSFLQADQERFWKT